MNVKEIKEMIILMNENNLSELEIEKEGMRIKLKKARFQTRPKACRPLFSLKEKKSPRPSREFPKFPLKKPR